MTKSPSGQSTASLDLVRLTALMELTRGTPEVRIGLIDGPVLRDHPDLVESPIQEIPSSAKFPCQNSSSSECMHGTYVAGILSARRGSDAPGISPGCTLLVRPILSESTPSNGMSGSSTTPEALAAAVFDCINAGARIINLSLALVRSLRDRDLALKSALDYALLRGTIVVAATGNQGMVGSTLITRHPWVIPTAACNREGMPSAYSNIGLSIGARGLRAPGEGVVSSGTDGKSFSSSGTSAAAPFVTGTIALLWSLFPSATARQVQSAVAQPAVRRGSVVPPLLDAWSAYQTMKLAS